MIPELYNQAYQRYLSEYEQLANDLGVVNTQQQLDYKEYLDRLGQYNTDKNFAYQQYLDDYNKLLSYLDAVNGQEQMDYQEYKDKLGQFNVDKEFAYQQYLDNYNQLQSYLEGLQKANDSEYQQYVDQLDWEREQQQQAQKAAQTQVDGILQAGVMPSSDLIAKSGYTQEYVNAMLQYYRQKAAAAFRSSGSGGSSKSSGSTVTKVNGPKPGPNSNTSNLVSVPQYGEMAVADAERLVQAGLLRRTGFDKNGKPTYIATAKKPDQYIPMTR